MQISIYRFNGLNSLNAKMAPLSRSLRNFKGFQEFVHPGFADVKRNQNISWGCFKEWLRQLNTATASLHFFPFLLTVELSTLFDRLSFLRTEKSIFTHEE